MINRAGLKVIVDMHLIPAGGSRKIGMAQGDGRSRRPSTPMSRWCARWRARWPAKIPTQVAFEPMNEPIVDCDSDGTSLWPERQQKLFAAARASATRLTLVLTGACYSAAGVAGEDRPEGDPRRQRHLDLPLLRSVPADPSGRDLGRRFHSLCDRPALSADRGAARRARRDAGHDPRQDQGRGAVDAAERPACLSRRAGRQHGQPPTSCSA